ncbi:hypothetical protein [Propionivibrio sp.]|uniref:hypothetical protein n=1 Tax=Propionivibrio sp. TaxID=2212460 RepID=UPI003BF0E8E5
MAITKDINRQEILSALVTINVADVLGKSGVAQAAVSMPPNCIVIGGAIVTRTAFNSVTSDVLSVGDAGLATRYLSESSVAVAGTAALVPTGYLTPGTTSSASGDIFVTWTGVGTAPSTGQVQLRVDYVQVGRSEYSQD